jgi:HEPN domain-containing protein
LAVKRLREAEVLLKANCPDGAYYLAGYAAECAIKACIAKQTERHEFPDKKRADRSWQHDPSILLDVAKLKDLLKEDAEQRPEFDVRWQVVQKWKESSRYENHSTADAEKLVDALKHPRHGVLRWLKRHW